MKKVVLLLLFGLVVGVTIGSSMQMAEAKTDTTFELLSPTSAGTLVGEVDDYRTLTWLDPWDMNNSRDLAQLDSPCTEPNQFSGSQFSGGIWTGTPTPARTQNHWIYLLSPEFPSTLPVGLDGRLQPIDPKVYTQLTIKMYVSAVDPNTDTGARLIWTRQDGRDGNNGSETEDWGDSRYFRTYAGWHIYSIDLTKIGLLSGSAHKMSWTDADRITGLRLYPSYTSGGKEIKIDWVRLSPPANQDVTWRAEGTIPGDEVSFALDSGDGMGNIPVHFYTDQGTAWAVQPDKVLAGDGSFAFPASLPPGDHSLRATVGGESDSGIWQIDAAPLLTFSNPDYFSGEEYATSVTGDPWDFNTLQDIEQTQNITSAEIENGTYKASHAALGAPCSRQWSDSAVYLRMGAPIDPNKYRYLSYDVRLAGTPDILNGWMSRVFWYDAKGFPNIGSSNDIINRSGWNRHIIDMWRTDLQDDGDPGLRGWAQDLVTQMRIDIDTAPGAQTFYLDNVELHALPVSTGAFSVTWTLSEIGGVAITLGYDTDQTGYDGTVITTDATGNSYLWNTQGVNDGAYYLYALVDDGLNQTRFYSSAPVQVIAAVSDPVFTNPSGADSIVALGTEFARDVLLNHWDMSSATDIDRSTPDRYNGLTEPTFDGTTMSARSTTHDPYFYLSWSINKPIDAAVFNRLSLRMYSDRAGQGQLWWFTDEAQSKLIEGPRFTVAPGWQDYYFDLTTEPGWSGKLRLFRIDPLDKSDAMLMIDWVRLTTKNQRSTPIQWTADDLTNSRLSLYYADDKGGSNKHRIAENIDGASGTYSWDTSHLTNGTFYLFGYISVQSGPGVWFSSAYGVKIPNPYISLTSPSTLGVSIAETPDYRTLVWRDPWDMDKPSDMVQLDSPCLQPNQFSTFEFSNGIWTGIPDPYYGESHWVALLSPGYRGALPVDIDGRLRSIDTNYYTQLTIKMYVSAIDAQTDPGARILWTRTDLKAYGDAGEGADWGESNYFRTYPGWHIYTIDLTKIGLLPGPSRLGWTEAGQVTGLRIDPDQKSSGKTIQIDWVRLSPRSNQQIRWNSQGISDLAEISFAVDSGDGMGAIPIHFYGNKSLYDVTQPEVLLARNEVFSFPASLPPGTQTLYASAGGGGSNGTWQIDPAPLLSFVSPSPLSGEEYAASTLGDPWDFNSLSDLDGAQNVTSGEIIDGVFKGSHAATGAECFQQWSDSGLFLRMGTPIDPDKYRYLTFKSRMEGEAADINNGWMSRVIWYDADGYPNVGTSQDIINRVGWNVHTIDMWQPGLQDDEDPGMRSWRQDMVTQLRIDVDEVPQAQTFYLDDVVLHAIPVASGNLQIRWDLTESQGVSVSLGYDNDASGYDGSLIAEGLNGTSYTWDTSSVPDGLYYIYAFVSDGLNQSRFYSNAPVKVMSAPSEVVFTHPNGSDVYVPLGSEYARYILQNPWDMNESDDLDRSDGSRYNALTEPSFDKGVMSTRSTTADPYLWLSWDINKPIDATRFNRLALHLYSDRAGQGQLWWFTHETNSQFIEGPKFIVSPGWRVYYFDLSAEQRWGGFIRLLRIDPLDKADANIKIDWVRLTQKNERTLTVTWQGENLAGSSIALYYGVDRHGTEKRLIEEGIPAAVGNYVWDTTHLPQGIYYLYGHLTNGSGSGLWTYTSSLVSIGIDTSRQTLKVFIPTVNR